MQPQLAYNDGSITLFHGDALQVLADLDDEIADSVVTDPSYGIAYKSNRAQTEARKDLNQALAGDEFVDTEWLAHSWRLLKPGGALYLFTRWDVFAQWQQAVTEAGFAVKNHIVWVKSNHTAGDLYGNYAYKWESILFAAKGRHIPLWEKRETNVWTDKSLTSAEPRVHPTQKPTGVMAHCIANSTPPDGLTIDPFVGSGTSLIAARDLGVQGIGIEINQEYVEKAVDRLI